MNAIETLLNDTSKRFILIAGPCVVESKSLCFEVASELKKVCDQLRIKLIFKGSFVKANRTRYSSFRTIGIEEALEILSQVREHFDIPVVTDIHETHEAELAAKYVDIIQIPAFLSRQTFLIEAAAKTGKPINLKKGEFMTTETLKFQVEKVKHTNPNATVLLTERGVSFGRNDIVIDFREVTKLKEEPFPSYSIVDCSHSVQRVNLEKGISMGDYRDTYTLAKASIAVGADGVFIETHPNPNIALSDSASMMPLNEMPNLLEKLVKIWDVAH
ncbi:3-deoxy-8-phosphooctulonate synthase [Cytophagaceae bacterium DM2B3-1]|uniref:3-deoxy-8-phosphooctulonate synthase n=1 Tax=Xanthocytophaga flava TaxID=3048013 RepID=A0ABT7CYG9_9BACT|nr:3-deoxy-8-phosphooctulonate synthase [Xanthocytophaga flavus]MDJ1498792.1 3-deoxy-8-phosphooctulonate synthase [Xanthocytophaga flavus]